MISPGEAPTFSFVIPMRNSEKTISDTLRSIQQQSLRDFEIIVVDNLSEDSSRSIVAQVAGVRLVDCSRIGRSSARNAGAQVARGKVIAFVDSDVTLEKDWLEKAFEMMESKFLDAVATRLDIQTNSSTGRVDWYRRLWSDYRSDGTNLIVHFYSGGVVSLDSAACLIRREAFDSVKGFDEEQTRHEDWDLSRRLFSRSYSIGGTTRAQAFVRYESARSGARSQEIEYLKRAFEISEKALIPRIPGKSMDPGLFRRIYLSDAGWSFKAFFTLVQLSDQAGLLYNIARVALGLQSWKEWTAQAGPGQLRYSFKSQGRLHVLKVGSGFIWSDERVFAIQNAFFGPEMSQAEAAILRSILAGKKLSVADAKVMVKTGMFETR